ncbi:hypothetical protein J4Q44_G00123030 [Coregonus suidteri]|uniref:Uncharacterized protein n=1 Tax=Coregonus suidteri TaxID=861788 RepID=A0AAN8LQS1_9TELE
MFSIFVCQSGWWQCRRIDMRPSSLIGWCELNGGVGARPSGLCTWISLLTQQQGCGSELLKERQTAEQYSGRNTRDSYPAGGPHRGTWAPVNSRPWGPSNRYNGGINQSQHLNKIYNDRGARPSFHSQGRGPQQNQRPAIRPWAQKDQAYETQGWHQDSPRSFQNHGRNQGGYQTGPGEPYTIWDSYNNQPPRYGGPHQHQRPRDPPGDLGSPAERWAASDRSRAFPGRMIDQGPGPWKRPPPHKHHRGQPPHRSPPSQHSPPPKEDCPAKRSRTSGPEQPSHRGSKHLSGPDQPQSPPHYLPPKQGFWNQSYDRPGPRTHAERRTSSTELQESTKSRLGRLNYSTHHSTHTPVPQVPFNGQGPPPSSYPRHPPPSHPCGGSRPPHHGSRVEVDGQSQPPPHQQTTPACLTVSTTSVPHHPPQYLSTTPQPHAPTDSRGIRPPPSSLLQSLPTATAATEMEAPQPRAPPAPLASPAPPLLVRPVGRNTLHLIRGILTLALAHPVNGDQGPPHLVPHLPLSLPPAQG